jgi:hypothetical protein
MKRARRGSTPRAAEPPGWPAAAPDDSDFQAFSRGDFIGAPAASPFGNPNPAGVAIEAIPSLVETGVIVSRPRRVGESKIRAAGRVRCPHDRLRHRLPVDHTAAHPRGRGSF